MLLNEKIDVEKEDLLFFLLLFAFYRTLIPNELGTWNAEIKIQEAIKSQTHRKGLKPKEYFIENSFITFEPTDIPEVVKSEQAFLNFDYVKATINASGIPPVNKEDEHSMCFFVQLKEAIIRDLKASQLQSKKMILVKAKQVFKFFLEKFNINLTALAYYLHVTTLPNYNYAMMPARETIKNQLGIDAENIYDSQRVYFIKSKENCEEYLLLDYVLAMYAFALLHQTRKFILPNNECCILFQRQESSIDERKLKILFFDDGYPLEDRTIELVAHPLYSTELKDIILFIKRKKQEFDNIVEKLKEERTKDRKGFRIYPRTEKKHIITALLKQLARSPTQEIKDIVNAIQNSYIELTDIAANKKEPILYELTKKISSEKFVKNYYERFPELRGKFLAFPGNTEGMWGNFAHVPIGMTKMYETKYDQNGKEIVVVRRHSFLHKNKVVSEHAPLIIPLEKVTIKDIEREELIECVELMFGKNSNLGLLIQAMVAIGIIVQNQRGLSHPGKRVKIYINEVIDVMRPHLVDSFKKEGRNRAFGMNYNPHEIIKAAFELQSRLYYKRIDNRSWDINNLTSKKTGRIINAYDSIEGFYHIEGRGHDSKGDYYEVVLNTKIFELIFGANPLFMQINSKAMFSHDERNLDYGPSSQVAMELLIRQNYYSKDKEGMSFGKKNYESGISRKSLISKFGFIQAKGESPSHLINRLERTLKTQTKVGILKEYKINGQENKDKMETQLIPIPHDDYKLIYNINRREQELAKINKRLEAALIIGDKKEVIKQKTKTLYKKHPDPKI